AEIDLGLPDRCPGARHLGLRLQMLGPPLVDRRLRNVLAARELLGTRELDRCVGRGGLGARQVRLLLREFGLVGRALDEEQQVAALYVLALLELAAFEKSSDPRLDLDLLDRLDAA